MTALIILFVVSFIAAAISGAAGFGGALMLLPVLTMIVGAKAAIPIITIGSIFGNASRVWFGRHKLQWKPILYFSVAAIPFSVLGSRLFAFVDGQMIKMIVGLVLIAVVIYRRMPIRKWAVGNKEMALGGGLTGFLSGLAGSAGPLGAAFFLGLNLPATAYVASEAFSALAMHLTKTIVYQRYALIGQQELLYGLFIGVAMIAGSWTGKKIIERLSKERFRLLVEALLFLSAVQLIVAP